MSTLDLTQADEHDGRAATTSATRLIGLSLANARLMLRNPMTLAYGIITPLFPLGFVLASDGKEASVASGISLVLTIAWLLPVYYNILSIIVSRRDELVLKRLRTGEARDGELLLSMCLPGIAIAMVVSVLAALVATAVGHPPGSPATYLMAVLGGSVMCAALAVWTASWTRNAEAAQMTSMPVFTLLVVGMLGGVVPEGAREYVALTPGGALDTLARVSWGVHADALQASAVVVAWTCLALWIARRSMRWEPRR
jgi:ABC-2 type transport system permease protein